MLKRLLLCSLLVSLNCQASVPVITWVKNDAPPFFNITGKGTLGVGDIVQMYLEDHLDGFQHQTEITTLARLNNNWQAAEPRCFTTMIHGKPRNPSYLLSNPTMLYYAQGIIYHKDNQQIVLDELGRFDFTSLTKNSPLIMAQSPGRAYGEALNDVLLKHADHYQLYERPASDETQGLLHMLVNQRFDFVVDYEMVLRYHSTDPRIRTNLRFAPILGFSEHFIVGAVGCTNSPWGEETIAHINQVLPDIVNDIRYRTILQQWFMPLIQPEKYWHAYQQFVLAAQIASQGESQ